MLQCSRIGRTSLQSITNYYNPGWFSAMGRYVPPATKFKYMADTIWGIRGFAGMVNYFLRHKIIPGNFHWNFDSCTIDELSDSLHTPPSAFSKIMKYNNLHCNFEQKPDEF